MMLCIGDVFDQAEAAALRSEVEHLRFADGRGNRRLGCEVGEEQRAG